MYFEVIKKQSFNLDVVIVLNAFQEQMKYWRFNPVVWYYVGDGALYKVEEPEALEKAYQKAFKKYKSDECVDMTRLEKGDPND